MTSRLPERPTTVGPGSVWFGLAALAAVVLCGTCATRGAGRTPAWAATPQAQVPGPNRSAPPPAINQESDPENVEQRFGFAEAKARRDYARQNGQKNSGPANASQAVVPMPQGSPVPSATPPVARDAGAIDGGSPLSR